MLLWCVIAAAGYKIARVDEAESALAKELREKKTQTKAIVMTVSLC